MTDQLPPFGGALVAAPGSYLGDPTVVRKLVDELIEKHLAYIRGDGDDLDLNAEEHRLALIFAGRDPGFVVIGAWNLEYEGIGAAARHHIGATYGELVVVETLEDAFFQLRRCVIKVFLAFRGPQDDRRFSPDVAPHIQALAGFTTAVLLGLPVEGWLHDLLPEAANR